MRLRSSRGLSRARNEALPRLEADAVAFPDDDCEYPDDLLERVAGRLAASTGSTGSPDAPAAADGATAGRGRRAPDPRDNVWNRGISYGIFLRRELVERVGRLRRVARARRGHAVVVGRGDRLPVRAVDAGGADRVRPDGRRLARGEGLRPGVARGASAGATGRASATCSAAPLRARDEGADARAAAGGGAARARAARPARAQASTPAARLRGRGLFGLSSK